MEPEKERHKIVRCKVCSKDMRSDNLKRHMHMHKDILMNEEESKRQKIEEGANQEGVSMERYEEITDLRQDLLKDNQLYLEKIELGKKIADIIDEGVVREGSLTKDRKLALELYRKQRPCFDITSVQLRPWQEQAIELIETPSQRQVIWITGRQGNEGKSWFQCYIESYFGFNRVVRIDLRVKHANLCNVLKKRSLGSIDIFLFNDARSVSGEELNLYRILEDIKDGQATASKYDNDNIRFKTPNTVMIFSNQYPKTQNLSRDRWTIYNANQDGLNNVTLQVMKMKSNGYNAQNNDHLRKHML